MIVYTCLSCIHGYRTQKVECQMLWFVMQRHLSDSVITIEGEIITHNHDNRRRKYLPWQARYIEPMLVEC